MYPTSGHWLTHRSRTKLAIPVIEHDFKPISGGAQYQPYQMPLIRRARFRSKSRMSRDVPMSITICNLQESRLVKYRRPSQWWNCKANSVPNGHTALYHKGSGLLFSNELIKRALE